MVSNIINSSMFAYISKYVWITEVYQILTITQDMQYIQTIILQLLELQIQFTG